MARVEAADYHDIAKPEDPRLSPDGERVAFVRKVPDDEESYEGTVYLVPADGSEEPVQFTVREGVDSQPRWSPSGDRIAFVSTRGADDDRAQLWIIPVGGGEGRQVTDVPGGVGEIAWSPDGERVAFVQSTTAEERAEGLDLAVDEEDYERETPDPRVIDRTVYRSMQRYFDGTRSHVYVAHLADDEVERITDGDVDHASPEWGDATTLYYTASDVGEDPDDSTRYSIYARDTGDDDAEKVHEASGWGRGLAATADGRVAHLFSAEEQSSLQPTELHVYDRAGGEVTDVTAGLDRTLGYEAAPQWGPDGELLYFTTPDEGKVSLWSAPGDGSAAPERALRPGTVSGADVGDGRVALAMSEWDHPGDVFVGAPGDDRGDLTRLSELNAEYLEEVELREPEELRVESEGVEVHGWVLTPPGFDEDEGGDEDESEDEDDDRGTEEYPLAVEIHGGPHAMWTTAGTMWHEFQTLAARGYVVFWSNPRGSTGYGEDYAKAIERDWGEVTLTDVMAGVEAVADRGSVDDSNAFLTGGSFGGFMTSWTVGQTDYFRAAVAQRGVYDLTGFYGSTDGAYKLVEGDFDTTPWEEPGFLWEQSPTGHAHEVDTPTLLVHSDDDYRTPACTAELYYRLLRKQGVDTRLVRYPREGHELSRSGEPGHVVDRIERIVRWFDGYSEHHDAPRALDRDRNEGLSAGDEEGRAEGGDGDDDREE